jgi:hypothetical protein
MKYWLSRTNLPIRKKWNITQFQKIDVYCIIHTHVYLQANVHHSHTLCFFEELMKYIYWFNTIVTWIEDFVHGVPIYHQLIVLLRLYRAQM